MPLHSDHLSESERDDGNRIQEIAKRHEFEKAANAVCRLRVQNFSLGRADGLRLLVLYDTKSRIFMATGREITTLDGMRLSTVARVGRRT